MEGDREGVGHGATLSECSEGFRMKRRDGWMAVGGVAAGLLAALIAGSQPSAREQVGPLAGGGFLLSSGWKIMPAGEQNPLATFPEAPVTSTPGHNLPDLKRAHNPPALRLLPV